MTTQLVLFCVGLLLLLGNPLHSSAMSTMFIPRVISGSQDDLDLEPSGDGGRCIHGLDRVPS